MKSASRMFWGYKNEDKKFAKHSEEWDFRRVPLELLHLAILYEYARESDWVKKEFERWHQERLSLPVELSEFKKWDGKTVGEALEHAARGELPEEVFAHLLISQPERLERLGLNQLTNISPFFPKPFLSLDKVPPTFSLVNHVQPENLSHLLPRWKQKRCGFRTLESLPKFSERQKESSAGAGIFYLAVKIDLSVGKKQFKEDAGKVFDELDKSHSNRKTKVLRAKATKAPWHQLKELAAFRFNKQGADHVSAGECIKTYAPPMEAENVLPRYSGSGAWSKAVENAENRIRELYPEP